MKLLFAVYQYVVIFLLFLDRLPLALSFTMLKCDFFFFSMHFCYVGLQLMKQSINAYSEYCFMLESTSSALWKIT